MTWCNIQVRKYTLPVFLEKQTFLHKTPQHFSDGWTPPWGAHTRGRGLVIKSLKTICFQKLFFLRSKLHIVTFKQLCCQIPNPSKTIQPKSIKVIKFTIFLPYHVFISNIFALNFNFHPWHFFCKWSSYSLYARECYSAWDFQDAVIVFLLKACSVRLPGFPDHHFHETRALPVYASSSTLTRC